MDSKLSTTCDVAIIGGGPAGSSVASLLMKYNPRLNVVLLEREKFPREHVGESLLPAVCNVLDEMRAWDKVEAANFPIKIGATYRWGNTQDLWTYNFSHQPFQDEIRPAKFEGQRKDLAFQVDRAIYDKILLDNARDWGCQVFPQVKVQEVLAAGDRVLGLKLRQQTQNDLESTLVAKYYVDASGTSGILRRAVGVELESPTSLRNVAFWDYWQNAQWAESVGIGGTRIQVMSLAWGWLWFIPVTSSRTSIGLVMPAQTYKESGKRPLDLYMEAVSSEPRISELVRAAKMEGNLQTTNDWSCLASKMAGENWFLAGDTCGFADPILSAGLTLAQTGARRVAYSILEIIRGELDCEWVKEEYSEGQRKQIQHHIRFADFWYASNGCFTDLKENCSAIATEAGLVLNAEEAFRWLSTGGFTNEDPRYARAGTYSFNAIADFAQRFTGGRLSWQIAEKNEFKLNLAGAFKSKMSVMANGRIKSVECYRRGSSALPIHGIYQLVLSGLQRESDGYKLLDEIASLGTTAKIYQTKKACLMDSCEVLESMIRDKWVVTKVNKKRPTTSEYFKHLESAPA
jgi:flavin-dependent dehydrogenase